MGSCWFGDITDGACTPIIGDATAYAKRVHDLVSQRAEITFPDWNLAVVCGICKDRAEYLALLQKVCIAGSEEAVREQYSAKDMELLQMVRTLDEMDTVINLLSERVADWYQIRHPSFSRKYRRTPAHVLIKSIGSRTRDGRSGGGALSRVAGGITSLSDTRLALAKEISNLACTVMPNTSALIGGLVAARLLSHAGGLKELSRMPASTIQVIGARTALFMHIRTHAPSPKHGIIFQHRRVHNAPRDVRGKVSRILAGKLAIAAKLDYYRGEADAKFLENAQNLIDRAGGTGKEADI